MKPGIHRRFRKRRIRKSDAVRGTLNVRKAHLFRFLDDVDEPRVDRWLAPGKLNELARNRTEIAKLLEHDHNLGVARFQNHSRDVGVGITDRAFQVATVREVHHSDRSVTRVEIAHSAVRRTNLSVRNRRI